MLHPVDDYVREFSKDVVKGRHAKVGSIMRAASQGDATPDDPGIRSDMTLEEALASCMSLYHPVPVWGPDGTQQGVVDPKDLAAALQVDDA